ncbi:transposase [Enhydrobacter sp. AX1]|nr:transposase [Enhydrobacter sp. AX1]
MTNKSYPTDLTDEQWQLIWLNNARRLAKDFEITVLSAESFIKIAHITQLLRNMCL